MKTEVKFFAHGHAAADLTGQVSNPGSLSPEASPNWKFSPVIKIHTFRDPKLRILPGVHEEK